VADIPTSFLGLTQNSPEMRALFNSFLVISTASLISSYDINPGPLVIATTGEIWPKPKKQQSQEEFVVLLPSRFKFTASNYTCDIVNAAFERYHRIIATQSVHFRRYQTTVPGKRKRQYRVHPLFSGNLGELNVVLRSPCEVKPYLGMDESYSLAINNGSSVLESKSVWGILRGLESFSQLLTWAGDGSGLRINHTTVLDEPRFSWRGLLIDTSRHYINPMTLFQIIEGMSYNKLNVFHWHIVDDQSFPYESATFPELSAKGAYHPKLIYHQNDIAKIIEFARLRGIRVVAEFDTPGHTRSWGVAHPELLTTCEGSLEGYLGPMDPTNDGVYEFLDKLFREIVEVFPDKYVHLGGDEVDFDCWESNSNITAYMRKNGLYRYEKLEEIFIQKLVDRVDNLNTSSIVWQEVYVNGVNLPKKTVVHIWTGDRYHLLNAVTGDGHPALLSSCWYLDWLATGGDWKKYYNCDPHIFKGTDEQKKLVLGGEACMWAESVDSGNIIQRIFPRVSAAAEKLWSQIDVTDEVEASRRLEEHYCRMNIRGIQAQPPNGPGFCL